MIFYGASGHAKVIIEAWLGIGGKIDAIFDDNEKVKNISGLPVAGKFRAGLQKEEELIISIGSNSIRKRIADSIKARYGRVIHSRATLSFTSTIGEGTVVMAHVAVNSDTLIGKHCILNTSCSVDHDCIIGDFVHIAPGSTICGGVTIGEGTLIGAGSVVLPNIKIGAWSVVGAGSVVTKNIGDKVTVAGNPAKSISFKQTE